MLRPTFTLTIGSLQSSSAKPTGGPRALVVERDMDVPADALSLRLMDASGSRSATTSSSSWDMTAPRRRYSRARL